MLVVLRPKYSPPFLLRAHLAVLDPLIVKNFFERGALFGVDLKHPANNVSAFSGQQAQQSPRALDDLRWLLLLLWDALAIRRFRAILVSNWIRMPTILPVVVVMASRLLRRMTRGRFRLDTCLTSLFIRC